MFQDLVEDKGRNDALARGVLLAQVLGVTVFQKFVLTIAAGQLFLGIILFIGATAVGILTGRLEVSKTGMSLYLLLVGILTLTQLIPGVAFSILSLVLLFIMHSPYAFQIKQNLVQENLQFILFQKIMIVMAALAVVQFFGQYILPVSFMYPLDMLLPKSIVAQQFHGLHTMSSGVNKATAIFFLEPAILSQFLAVSLIIETIYFKNLKRITLFLFALALTFSGTGLIILFVLLPIYLLQKRQFILLALAAMIVTTAPVWAPWVGMEKTISRAGEFTNEHSSGYARFISIFPTLNTFIVPNNETLIFGLGAGSISRTLNSQDFDYAVHNPSWGKMVFEYGILGGLAYFIFMGYFFSRAQVSPYIKAAILIQFFLLGEYILPTTVHGLILALIVWPPSSTSDGLLGKEDYPQEEKESEV